MCGLCTVKDTDHERLCAGSNMKQAPGPILFSTDGPGVFLLKKIKRRQIRVFETGFGPGGLYDRERRLQADPRYAA